MSILKIFTDGSCHSNGKIEASAGYGIYFPNKEYPNINGELLYPPITNQRSELYAILESLNIINIKEYDKIFIYTDSMYCINCLTKWIYVWEKNKFKTVKKKDVLNKDLIIPIWDIIKLNNHISFVHVKAHSNKTDEISLGNKNADRLANDAIHK